MRAYVDHLLALLPFEPEAHRRLGGPPTTYVGHPLIERLDEIRPVPGERGGKDNGPIRLLVLPGSRRSEVSRLMEPFGAALALLKERSPRSFEVTIPAVSHLAQEIRTQAEGWSVKPRIVEGEAAKWKAFREADAALAASGTVTLELGLSGVPMVVAYRVSKIEEVLKYLIKAPIHRPHEPGSRRERHSGADPVGLHAGKARRCAPAASERHARAPKTDRGFPQAR